MGKLYRAGSLRGPARLNPRSRAHGELEPGRVRNSGDARSGKPTPPGNGHPSSELTHLAHIYTESCAGQDKDAARATGRDS